MSGRKPLSNKKPTLVLVTSKTQRKLAEQIVREHHSYVPTFRSVGRRIDWLVEYENEIVGMIGLGSSTYPPPKDLLRYLNMNKNEYKKVFNNIANNWRFCLKKKIPNLGTMVLRELRNIAGAEWKKKYNNDLQYIITFVGGGNSGAVYKADNWEEIGMTAGLPQHRSSSMKWHDKEELKKLFVKPTGENKKKIFIKQL
jgi:hypothetical protein